MMVTMLGSDYQTMAPYARTGIGCDYMGGDSPNQSLWDQLMGNLASEAPGILSQGIHAVSSFYQQKLENRLQVAQSEQEASMLRTELNRLKSGLLDLTNALRKQTEGMGAYLPWIVGGVAVIAVVMIASKRRRRR